MSLSKYSELLRVKANESKVITFSNEGELSLKDSYLVKKILTRQLKRHINFEIESDIQRKEEKPSDNSA